MRLFFGSYATYVSIEKGENLKGCLFMIVGFIDYLTVPFIKMVGDYLLTFQCYHKPIHAVDYEIPIWVDDR